MQIRLNSKTIIVIILLIVFLTLLFGIIFLTAAKKQNHYDLDFTKMNFDMASEATFAILIEPEKYVNKSVKIYGQFVSSVNEGKRYNSIVIWDSTKCCPTSLPLIHRDPAAIYPDDYPESESYVTATGTLNWMNKGSDDEQVVLLIEKWY